MSNPAIFQISTSDGAMSEQLNYNSKLDEWISSKLYGAQTTPQKAQAYSSIDLNYLKQSHNVPFETSYWPTILYGSEYTPVSIQSMVNPTTGGEATYSLPVSGDFISDSVMQTTIGELKSLPGLLPALPIHIDTLPWDVAVLAQQTVTLPNGQTISIVDPIAHNFKTVTYKYLDTMTGQYVTPDSISSTQ